MTYEMFIASDDGIYVYGSFKENAPWDANFPGTPAMVNPLGDSDVVLLKYDLNGNYQWSKSIGGSSYDEAYEISVNPTCHSVYAMGDSYPDPGGGTISLDGTGGHTTFVPDTGGFFVTRFSDKGYFSWSNFNSTIDNLFYVTQSAVGPSDTLYFSGDANGSNINFNAFGGTDLLDTGGKSYPFITKLHSTNYRQHVINLDASVGAAEVSTGDDAEIGAVGVARSNSTAIRIPDANNGLTIADIQADLSCDRDWSGVTGDSSVSAGAAFIHDLTAAEGVASTLDLYIPKTTSAGVGICPGATSIASMSNSCSGYYELASGHPNLQTTTIGGQQYWHVLGISDSGGFNVGQVTQPGNPPNTTNSPATPNKLENTGVAVLTYLSIGIGLVTAVFGLNKLRSKYLHYNIYR